MLGVWFKLGNNIITLTDNSVIIQSLGTVLTGLLTGSVRYSFIHHLVFITTNPHPFQSLISTQCDLVFLLSIFSII